jgi:phasin family protein
MTVTPENLIAAGKAGFKASIAIAQAQFAAAEKLAALNMTSAKSTFEEASAHLRSVITTQDPQELIKLNSGAAQPALQKAVSYAQSFYDVATQAQANVAKIVEAQTAEMNRAFASTIDALAKSAPAGSEGAINMMKSSFAAFNSAYDGWSKVAKQTADVTQTNFADVSKARAKRG